MGTAMSVPAAAQVTDNLAMASAIWRYEDGSPIVSINSTSPVKVFFHNDLPYDIQVLWVDFRGNQKSYGIVKANTKERWLFTFRSHPWIFRVVQHPELDPYVVVKETQQQVYFPSGQDPETQDPETHVNLVLAPVLPWTFKVHKARFSGCRPFVQEIQSLLRAHHRLRAASHSAEYPSAHTCPESPPLGKGCYRAIMSTIAKARIRSASEGHSSHSQASEHSAATMHTQPAIIPAAEAAAAADAQTASATGPGGSSSCDGSSSPLDSHPSDLGDVPLDVLLHIIALLAPQVPDVRPVRQADMELPADRRPHWVIQQEIMQQQQQQAQAQQQGLGWWQ